MPEESSQEFYERKSKEMKIRERLAISRGDTRLEIYYRGEAETYKSEASKAE